MSDIYEQHRAAFNQVSAFVIIKDNEQIGTVALKFPRDGAGHLYAYVHFHGMPMVRARAGGYGYDKRSAAVHATADKIKPDYFSKDSYGNTWAKERKACEHFRDTLKDCDGGEAWTDTFRKAGYIVMQAV